ncbi:hypothetical protein pipiens_004671 [Culex pipiens pipiens]|uniref:PHD-type domain-containing protein n=1 Tax=Culex pipiens pipiens TaxID=38569 RepID=A0ABD1CG92_CULPP
MDRPPQPCAYPNCNFNDLSIDCRGSCRQRFHAVCVGLSAVDVPVIKSSRNLFWFCDVCRNDPFKECLAPTRSLGAGKNCASTSCIFNDQRIKCDGACGKDFHGMCVKLSETDLAVIGSSPNIRWVCDGCNGKVAPIRDDPDEETPEIEAEHQVEDDSLVGQLENKFESIISKLTKLNTNLEKGVYNTPPDSSPNSEGNSGDLTRDENKTPDVKSPAKIFTFGSVKKSEAPLEKPNFSFAIPVDSVEMFKKSLAAQSFKPKLAPLKPAELVADKNNNPPKPALPKQVAEIAPTVKKDDSKFTLWIKFKDPNLPNGEMCRMVREALGMSAKDSVAAKSVVPNHLRAPVSYFWDWYTLSGNKSTKGANNLFTYHSKKKALKSLGKS